MVTNFLRLLSFSHALRALLLGNFIVLQRVNSFPSLLVCNSTSCLCTLRARWFHFHYLGHSIVSLNELSQTVAVANAAHLKVIPFFRLISIVPGIRSSSKSADSIFKIPSAVRAFSRHLDASFMSSTPSSRKNNPSRMASYLYFKAAGY